MKKLSLAICLAFAFFVAAAVAQTGTAPGSGQGTTGSSPSMQNGPSGQQPGQPGMTQPDNSTPMGQSDQSTSAAPSDKSGKGEKKLKGCVQSQGGQYVLESKHGKSIPLTGQEVSAHVGHEVAVKGTWESGSSAGTGVSSSSGATASGSEKAFNVASVEMISDTCKHKGSSGNMGTAPNGTNPSGTGSTTPPQ